MDEFEIELKQDFLTESGDLLEAAEAAFMKLEENREDSSLLNEIFRLAHNLKGTAQAVGFDQLSELTHIAENLILKLKEGIVEVNDEVVTILLEFKDKVNEMVDELKSDFDAKFEIEDLQKRIEIISQNGTLLEKEESSESQETPEQSLDSEESLDEITSEEIELLERGEPEISDAALESLRESGFDQAVIDGLKPIENEAIKVASVEIEPSIAKRENLPEKEDKAKKTSPTSGEVEESIRVNLSRIDQVNNVIGELVILQTVVSQRRYEFIQDELTNKSIGMMSKLFKEVQELVMSLRMLPLKGVFQKMNRIVRDTSKTLDKDVKLHMLGEETEVDKTVLEKLADPLVHIIRNAVDHGLEDTEDRLAKGKSKVGNVELFAFHEGNNLVIQVTDDGKGIDPNVIRKKAIDKKIITETSALTDNELINLIFHPGFSTKENVTEVSGRGVGMDVVKTNINALGGEVKLMSKVNEGSSLKIILPLTLAIIEGIVVNVQDDKYVIPLSQIHEITHIKSDEVESFKGVANLFKLRGEVLPLFFLNKKLGAKILETGQYTVIVVRGASYVFGIVVDDIVNQQQIVIKKLGEDIRGKRGVMGSAIMSDGMPSLILDILEMFKEDMKKSRGYQKFKERNIQVA